MYDREGPASLAAQPEQLIANPGVDEDVLSGVLSSIRLSGSLQFCFMPAGDWQTDDKPAFNKGEPHGYTPKGGTGAITRTLVGLAERYAG